MSQQPKTTPRHVAIVKPGEEPRPPRRGATALHVRVRQVLAAIETVRVKGADQFTASQIAEEIGCNTAAVLYALYHLEAHKVVTCLTPDKQRYRRWAVTDWDKVIAFRQALEAGQINLEEVQLTRPSVFQRFLDAVTGRRRQDTRLAALEDRFTLLERKVDDLIDALGGL